MTFQCAFIFCAFQFGTSEKRTLSQILGHWDTDSDETQPLSQEDSEETVEPASPVPQVLASCSDSSSNASSIIVNLCDSLSD